MTNPPASMSAFGRARTRCGRGVHHTLRSDVTAGVLLLAATVAALVLANSPAAAVYERFRDYTDRPGVAAPRI